MRLAGVIAGLELVPAHLLKTPNIFDDVITVRLIHEWISDKFQIGRQSVFART